MRKNCRLWRQKNIDDTGKSRRRHRQRLRDRIETSYQWREHTQPTQVQCFESPWNFSNWKPVGKNWNRWVLQIYRSHQNTLSWHEQINIFQTEAVQKYIYIYRHNYVLYYIPYSFPSTSDMILTLTISGSCMMAMRLGKTLFFHRLFSSPTRRPFSSLQINIGITTWSLFTFGWVWEKKCKKWNYNLEKDPKERGNYLWEAKYSLKSAQTCECEFGAIFRSLRG